MAVTGTMESEQPAPAGAVALFHDHRWRQVVADPDNYEAFTCNECGVVWKI